MLAVFGPSGGVGPGQLTVLFVLLLLLVGALLAAAVGVLGALGIAWLVRRLTRRPPAGDARSGRRL
jgi:hypothetical protein